MGIFQQPSLLHFHAKLINRLLRFNRIFAGIAGEAEAIPVQTDDTDHDLDAGTYFHDLYHHKYFPKTIREIIVSASTNNHL